MQETFFEEDILLAFFLTAPFVVAGKQLQRLKLKRALSIP